MMGLRGGINNLVSRRYGLSYQCKHQASWAEHDVGTKYNGHGNERRLASEKLSPNHYVTKKRVRRSKLTGIFW